MIFRLSTSLVVLFMGTFLALPVLAQDELAKKATWETPNPDRIRQQFSAWLTERKADELSVAKVETLLSNENIELGGDILESVSEAIAVVEPKLAATVASVRGQRIGIAKPDLAVMEDETLDPLARNNVALLVGRWMAQNAFYDEASKLLSSLKTNDVFDPGSLLFYQAMVQHRLYEKDQCLKTIDRLFENERTLPRRFVQVSRLMQMDIRSMKAESLDHAARMMDDINRRISLYRSGTKVIGQEKKVIDMLDKIIEELEKQQQQQQGSSTNPSSPMQDSRIAGGKGDGQAQSKNFGEGGEWGDMPPEKRAEAMAEMAKGLPPHYREVIEEYFREIANEEKDK